MAGKKKSGGLAARLGVWLSAHPRAVAGAVLGVLSALSLGVGVLVGAWRSVCYDCPSIAQIYTWEPKQSTKIFDRDGKLLAELFEERRTPVEIETLPEHVGHAFVAVEDKRFYQHDGLDVRRLITANLRNLASGRITGGGSTLTQQLARNMFENIGFQRTGMAGLTRKLKEARVARDIEAVYTKDEILQAYINQVNYGHGWRGIETASQHYFGKPAVELNPAEGAMLAAAVNRPGRYSPFIEPELTLQRRNLVLSLMVQQGYLDGDEAEQWRQQPLPTERHGTEINQIAPYFIEYVRTTLETRYGADLYNKGLRVHTTLDLEMQRAARTAMDSGWARIERAAGYRGEKYADAVAREDAGRASETKYVQGAFIALDAATGDVRALIGGRDFKDSKFNRATQAQRQAGSTFKPFVYATAIASGIPASHVMYDSPLAIELEDGSVYAPKNYDPDFRGPLTLRDALKHSINTIAVRLGMDVGLQSVAQTARDYGISTPVPVYASMPIGAASVIPIELTAAYSVFANAGLHVTPRFIVRVEDAQGRRLWETQPTIKEAADPAVAAITRDLMRTALDNGTGYAVRDPAQGGLPYTVPAAGKTGTTNDNTDIWFVGFTPDLVASAWFGFDRPQRIVPGATGGRFGAPVWGQFMRALYVGESPELPTPQPWRFPENVIPRQVHRTTGRLAAQWCASEAYTEYFIPGTEPTEVCDPYGGGGLFGTPLHDYPYPPGRGDTLRNRAPRDTTRDAGGDGR